MASSSGTSWTASPAAAAFFDNVPADSLFGALNAELLERRSCPRRAVNRRTIAEYTEAFYNTASFSPG